MLTELRTAWKAKPAEQPAGVFDTEFAAGISASARTVQRARFKLGLKLNPRRVTR
jgi:hypothetical protein